MNRIEKGVVRALVSFGLFVVALIVSLVLLSSCNVTRRTITESSYYQRGDTTITIVTKTIESYDATKK